MPAHERLWQSILIVLGFFILGVVTWVQPFLGYVLSLPVYAWVLFGRGASVLKGAWPATFLSDVVETERGAKILFSSAFVLETVVLIVISVTFR